MALQSVRRSGSKTSGNPPDQSSIPADCFRQGARSSDLRRGCTAQYLASWLLDWTDADGDTLPEFSFEYFISNHWFGLYGADYHLTAGRLVLLAKVSTPRARQTESRGCSLSNIISPRIRAEYSTDYHCPSG